jgi:hypothetical protein
MVTVWIRGARNLKNLDTGIMGDLSDPYVAVSVGKSQEQKTPTINNNLNPAWSSGNQFTFPVTMEDPVLRLRVMNHNYTKDQSLGEAEVDLRVMQYGRVCQFREPLREGQGAELEFDVDFRPTEYFLTVLESSSKLYLRVNGALGLKNTDTGLYNPVTGTRDLSDPYVVATVGRQQHKTPTIDDTLDPVWESFNNFTFSIGDDEHELRLEVFNENNLMRSDDSLGYFVLDLHYIPHNVWLPHREKLQAASSGELEFDIYFGPTEFYSLSCEILQAKAEQAKCAAEATRLSKEVQMADYAHEWLEDMEGMTKIPRSIVEKDWEHACGGRNLVIPAWIAVTSAQVQSLERQRSQHPQRVALFPEAESGGRPRPKLRVRILGAFDLSLASGDPPSAYCVCEVPGRDASRIQTAYVPFCSDPEWRHARTLRGWEPGDALHFSVYGVDPEVVDRDDAMTVASGVTTTSQAARRRPDKLLGQAGLPSERFQLHGFDGLLALSPAPRGTAAKLRVIIVVSEQEEDA